MARKTNYGFEKRQKEEKRRKKKEAKLEKKRAAKLGVTDETAPVDGEVDAAAEDEETSGDDEEARQTAG
ncbi:MAG TPA: hypothetical protein VFX92_03995 [Candidatus Krumholzibacteria bacterium]|nr:hypothetical protein [Candidatus Krumholzibacteria bacterium]